MFLRELKLDVNNNLENINLDSLGKRTKLGGSPMWIQSEENICCDSCNNKMSFVSQIDSIDYSDNIDVESNSEYMFGDVGMIYVFFCFDCLETKSIFQCY